MILCVCLNPAIDTTYRIGRLHHGATNRVTVLGRRAGGKALNVAYVLRQMGEPVAVAGLAGGPDGALVAAGLLEANIDAKLTPVAGQTRRTVTVVDDIDVTVLSEPGPAVSAAEWQEFCEQYEQLVLKASVVVLSGSIPPGLPAHCIATLTRMAHAAGAGMVLDTAGPGLLAALEQRPEIVKPNVDELALCVGYPLDTESAILAAARSLVRGGAKAVVVSRGAAGLLAVTEQQNHRVTPPTVRLVNPTGAGDALAAGLARELARQTPWTDSLAIAVSIAAAAVTIDVAGVTDLALAADLLARVSLELIP
jgi:tagatose 6-phosphate kinase